MNTLAAIRALGAIDLRNVARDPMLRWVMLLTPCFGLLFRYAVPPITAALDRNLGFELAPYYPLLMSFLPLLVAGMLGAVVGFLLLDQRDDQTLSALLVTPLSLADYLRYRMLVMLIVCLAFSWTVPLAGLTETNWTQILVSSLVAAPLAPIYALFLASFASNKVQGFALAKALGVVIVPCILAYFVTGPWQLAFGIVPHFWPMKVFWLFDTGATGSALMHALLGLAWQGMLLMLLTRRFARVARR